MTGLCRVTCEHQDGRKEDFTERLRSYGAHALLFLNIKSYSGGTRPWKQKAGLQSTSDNLVEVVAMDNVDLALLNLGPTFLVNLFRQGRTLPLKVTVLRLKMKEIQSLI